MVMTVMTGDGMITVTSTSAEFRAILIIITIFTSNLKIISNAAVSPRDVSQEISPSHRHQVSTAPHILLHNGLRQSKTLFFLFSNFLFSELV